MSQLFSYQLDLGIPRAAGTGKEQHHFTIQLENATIASARSMTGGSPVFAASASGSPVVAHELTHTVQQGRSSGAAVDETPVTLNFEEITWTYMNGGQGDGGLQNRTGSTMRVQAGGRTVLEGILKSVRRATAKGDVCTFELTGVKHY